MIDSATVVTTSHYAPRIFDRDSRFADEVFGFTPALQRAIAGQTIVAVLVEGAAPIPSRHLDAFDKFAAAQNRRYDRVFA